MDLSQRNFANILTIKALAQMWRKICTDIDNQSITLNMEESLHKINDLINNDVIIVKKLVEKTVKRV